MKKRLLALILCIVMLLSVLPVTASADGGKIDMLSVNGIKEPKDGEEIPFDSSELIPGDPSLYAAYYCAYSWSCPDGVFLPDTLYPPHFRGGETYTLTILIVPEKGVTGLDETTAPYLYVLLNGFRATYNPECKPAIEGAEGKDIFAYCVDFDCPWTNTISLIDVDGFTLPTPGTLPCGISDLSVPTGAPYSIESVKWARYKGAIGDSGITYMTEGEKFEAGKGYYIEIVLHANEGYRFDNLCDWRFNGVSNYVDETRSYSSDTDATLYSEDLIAEPRHVDTVRIDNVGTFFVGNTALSAIENATVPVGAGYSLYFRENVNVLYSGSYINDSTTFKKDINNYQVTFRVVPDTGWTIDSSTVWLINGGALPVADVDTGSDGSINYWYVRTSPTPSVEKQHIDTVYIYGVCAPVIGGTVGDYDGTYVLGGLYDIVETYWYCDDTYTELNDTDVFEKGKHYSLCNVVKVCADGFAIDDSTTFLLNHDEYKVERSGKRPDGSYYVWTEPMEAVKTYTVSWYFDPMDEYPVVGVEVPEGTVFGNPPEPGKEGYTFGGWFTDKALTKPYDSAKPITEDTNLYPKWEKKSCDGGKDCPSAKFTDVNKKPDFWYHNAIDWAVTNNVTSGTSATTFSPDGACLRCQAVTFLWRAAGSPEPVNKTNPFKDVKETDYFYKAVLWAVEKNITKGMSETSFAPNAECTRGQIVTFLYRYKSASAPTGVSNPFKDVAASDFFYAPVMWAVKEGITTGMSADSFAPNATCTRAHIVTFLYRAIE